MAPNATHHSPGRYGRVLLHWVFPSRRKVLVELAIEVAAALFGLPLVAHIIVAIASHFLLSLAIRKR
jgi:hypothetical protein